MGVDALKLTAYLGERDRAGGRFLAHALVDRFAAAGVAVSCVFRGAEGFGAKHHLRTDRLLTLSEDLPVVVLAVDRRDRIEALVPAVRDLLGGGLLTLEAARRLDDGEHPATWEDGDAAKLTVYVGRQERFDARPAAAGVVALLHRHGVAGATALLGVDGTVHGVRRRASMFGSNGQVPVMVVSVGDPERIAAVVPELHARMRHPLTTLERVRVLRRDGAPLAEPPAASGAAPWHKLTVYASEQTGAHHALVRRLRAEGAAGATALRGFWGYHGDHEPHGDRFWALRRRVPVVTTVVDRPQRMARWLQIAADLTPDAGLVTAERVPVAEISGGPEPAA